MNTSTVAVASVEVSTREYEFAHGRAPRGVGNWAFFVAGNAAREPFWFNGSYGQARVAAVRHFAALGVTDVVVGS